MSTPASQWGTDPNAEAIEAWDGPLFERFVQFRHLVTDARGEAALALRESVSCSRWVCGRLSEASLHASAWPSPFPSCPMVRLSQSLSQRAPEHL